MRYSRPHKGKLMLSRFAQVMSLLTAVACGGVTDQATAGGASSGGATDQATAGGASSGGATTGPCLGLDAEHVTGSYSSCCPGLVDVYEGHGGFVCRPASDPTLKCYESGHYCPIEGTLDSCCAGLTCNSSGNCGPPGPNTGGASSIGGASDQAAVGGASAIG